MGAWNIDYERDSEEVVFLKKHIAEQGWERLFISMFSLVHSCSAPQTVTTLLYRGSY
jgi:hypothetical protein